MHAQLIWRTQYEVQNPVCHTTVVILTDCSWEAVREQARQNWECSCVVSIPSRLLTKSMTNNSLIVKDRIWILESGLEFLNMSFSVLVYRSWSCFGSGQKIWDWIWASWVAPQPRNCRLVKVKGSQRVNVHHTTRSRSPLPAPCYTYTNAGSHKLFTSLTSNERGSHWFPPCEGSCWLNHPYSYAYTSGRKLARERFARGHDWRTNPNIYIVSFFYWMKNKFV